MGIVKRLRKWIPEENTYELLSDAANEIERLRQQNAILEIELGLVRSMLPNVKAYQTGTGDFTPLGKGE
jgi:hypothetical protein